MCGILGLVTSDPGRAAQARTLLSRLQHRGPDDEGSQVEEISGRWVFLGHRRLSVLDLTSAGHQPMESKSGQAVVIYNGELYNHQALAARHLKGSLRTRTDTEVLVEMMDAAGEDAIPSFRGDFAFAYLDRQRERLLLVRDRLGVKPLYTCRRGDEIGFCSEIGPLEALFPGLSVSEEAIRRFLLFKYTPGHDTLYGEVKRVAPGTIEDIDLASLSTRVDQYWAGLRAIRPEHGSAAPSTQELRELLTEATVEQLHSDVPVGVLMSGGLDSSIIAAGIEQEEVPLLCAVKDARDLRKEGTSDDSHYARLMAKHLGRPLQTIDISSHDLSRELIRSVARWSDDLVADGSQVPAYRLAEASAGQVSVLLSGMGADELFLGYAAHLLREVRRMTARLPGPLRRRLESGAFAVSQNKGALLAYRRWIHKFGSNSRLPADIRDMCFSVVGDVLRSGELGGMSAADTEAMLRRYGGSWEDGASVFQFEVDNFLQKNLQYFDRAMMASSIEGRVPFVDYRVAELAARTPLSAKLSLIGGGKRNLKRAFRHQLPTPILKRRKAGFGMPLRAAFSSPERSDSLFDWEFLNGCSVVDGAAVKQQLARHRSGLEDNSAALFAVVSLQEWAIDRGVSL